MYNIREQLRQTAHCVIHRSNRIAEVHMAVLIYSWYGHSNHQYENLVAENESERNQRIVESHQR